MSQSGFCAPTRIGIKYQLPILYQILKWLEWKFLIFRHPNNTDVWVSPKLKRLLLTLKGIKPFSTRTREQSWGNAFRFLHRGSSERWKQTLSGLKNTPALWPALVTCEGIECPWESANHYSGSASVGMVQCVVLFKWKPCHNTQTLKGAQKVSFQDIPLIPAREFLILFSRCLCSKLDQIWTESKTTLL